MPSQPVPNPRGQYEVTNPDRSLDEAKSITTLRYGRTINNHEIEASKKKVEEKPTPKESKEPETPSPTPYVPKAPFPHRLDPIKKGTPYSDILEVFKQVRINIPFLDAIQQVPSYAKFLKDLCTVKRKTNIPKTECLTEQVSSIIQMKTPIKYKDPGCPTISCVIGDHVIDRALLDLGASVNLLPYAVYAQLGLGELKPTPVRLQLADRSVKIPRGTIEDVLIKVDKFYFPVDFIVIDTQPVENVNAQIPVILGRPFLATSNAIINCRNGVMKLSFGNMTVELNVFSVCQQPFDHDDLCEVNLIDSIVYDSCRQSSYDDQLESCLAHFGMNFDDNVVINEVNSLLDSAPLMDTTQWKTKIESLPNSETIRLSMTQEINENKLMVIEDPVDFFLKHLD